MPVGVTVELAGGDFADTNIGRLSAASLFAPGDADFSGEFGDVFVVFAISPKLYRGTGFLV